MLIAEQKVNDAWFAPSRELNVKITMAGEVFDRTSVTSLSFDSGSISGETFQIGSAHMNQIQLEFPSIIQTVQKDLELSVELGILVEGSFHYSKLGTFLISEFDRNYNDKKTTITAVDKMCLLEGIYQSKLTYPSSMRNVALEIANLNGVEIDQVSFTRIPTTLIGQPVGYTSRQAIGLIAQFIGGFANFNREGKLQVKTLEPTEFVIGTENYLLKGFTKNESKYRINGISVKIGDEESDVLIVGETKGNVIHLENKIMTQDLLNSIWSNVKDIIYYPFELKWQGNPNLEAGDWFYVKDREGTLFSVPNLSYSFTYNGGMRADSKATTTTNSEVTYKYGGTLQQQVKEIFKRLSSANGWNANHYDSETEPENPRIGDLWFRKNGEAEEIWSYDLVEDVPIWVLKVSSAPNKELKEAIEEVKRIVQETSELAKKNTKQINDALESGEVLSLKDLFARKIGTDEFNTLFYQETNAIGLTYFVDGVMEAIIAIQEGIPLIKGKHIVLDGDTIIEGDFTVTGDMLADSAVIDKLKVQGIDAAQINVTNLNANSFTTGDIDALKIRIMAGDVPVMSVDDTGEVIFNVTKMKIGNIEAATKEDVNELEESTQGKLDEKANSTDVSETIDEIWSDMENKANQGELDELQLLAQQLQDSYEAYVDPEKGIAKENLDALYDRMSGFIVELQDKIATFDFIHTTIRLGDEGLSIGTSESSLEILLTNGRLSFFDGGEEVAYFSGQSFFINRGTVVEDLQIGEHKWVHLGNGDLILQYVGG